MGHCGRRSRFCPQPRKSCNSHPTAVSAFCLSSPSTLHGDVYTMESRSHRSTEIFQSSQLISLNPRFLTLSGRPYTKWPQSPQPCAPAAWLPSPWLPTCPPRAPNAPGAPPTLSLRVAAGFLHLVPGAEARAAVLTAEPPAWAVSSEGIPPFITFLSLIDRHQCHHVHVRVNVLASQCYGNK